MTETAVATFAGGCFWCIEAVFERVRGVQDVVSGYCGGRTANPSYREVCTRNTGHAEAVQVTYDPDEVGYDDLLEVFFSVHDPTTKDREGPDVGSQYRSAVFYHDDEQRQAVEAYIESLEANGDYDGIVTEVSRLDTFYRAEEKHQSYYEKNPGQPYCRAQIPPKLKKLEARHGEKVTES